MAKRKEKKLTPARPQLGDNVEILSAGEVLESAITDTLATDGMLVKRPLLIGDAFVLAGFRPADWEAALQ